MGAAPTVGSLLTDFGTSDHYVGVMKAVILTAAPGVTLIDLSHEVEPGAVAQGAFTLLASYAYFPAGSVHVAVVDPGLPGKKSWTALVDPASAGWTYSSLRVLDLDVERGALITQVEPGSAAEAARIEPGDVVLLKSSRDSGLRLLGDALVERLSGYESGVSEQRHRLHQRIDALQAEITRRYRTGQASVESLLR